MSFIRQHEAAKTASEFRHNKESSKRPSQIIWGPLKCFCILHQVVHRYRRRSEISENYFHKTAVANHLPLNVKQISDQNCLLWGKRWLGHFSFEDRIPRAYERLPDALKGWIVAVLVHDLRSRELVAQLFIILQFHDLFRNKWMKTKFTGSGYENSNIFTSETDFKDICFQMIDYALHTDRWNSTFGSFSRRYYGRVIEFIN